MWIICSVLHGRGNDVSQQIDPESLLDILMVSDKYDFHQALKYVIRDHMKVPKESVSRVEQGYLMAAAFLFGDKDIFAAHTLAVIMESKESFGPFFDDAGTSEILPPRLFRTFCPAALVMINI